MPDSAADPAVTVYWRPGCPFCAALRWRLRRLGVATSDIDIWSDPAAAEELRRIAGGNETVPTVVVGGIAMVNPTASQVLDAIRRSRPATVATSAVGESGTGEPGAARIRAARIGRSRRPAPVVAAWLVVSAAVVASFTVDALGYHGLSWACDGVAVAAYLVVRELRRRTPGPPRTAAGADRGPQR
jgi:mycoredoxin